MEYLEFERILSAKRMQRYKDRAFSSYNQVNERIFMEYLEFERILSAKRMQRYKDAANGDTRKAMALYRYNLRLFRIAYE